MIILALFGMDVSTYNRINYKAAKIAGVRFAMVKASQGHSITNSKLYMFEDSMFKKHIEGFTKVGIPVGAYHYFTATNLDECYKEADFFVKTCNVLKDKISLYLACDFERYKNKYVTKLNREQATMLINSFLKRVEAAGFKVCNYTNTDHILNHLYLSKLDYPVWHAHYIKDGSISRPKESGEKLAIHQYTDAGQLSGVPGFFDLDFGYEPLAKLIIEAKTPLEKQTLDYISRYKTGEDILIKLADKLVLKNLKPIKNPDHSKFVTNIKYYCGLSSDQCEYLNNYKYNTELFRKLYFNMIDN